MTREDVLQFSSRVNLATGRRIDEPQVELLYRELTKLDITNEDFSRLGDMYLNEEEIPKNIVKYFRDHRKRQNEEIDPTTMPYHDSVDGEYTGDQAAGFCRCVAMALRAYHGHRDLYDRWAVWFNGNWMAKTGEELDSFLNGEKIRLASAREENHA